MSVLLIDTDLVQPATKRSLDFCQILQWKLDINIYKTTTPVKELTYQKQGVDQGR